MTFHFSLIQFQTDTGSICVCSEGYSKGLVHGPGVRWGTQNISGHKKIYVHRSKIGLPRVTWGRCVTSRGRRVTWRMWPLWPASGWASASWLSSSGSHSDFSPRPGMWSQGTISWRMCMFLRARSSFLTLKEVLQSYLSNLLVYKDFHTFY